MARGSSLVIVALGVFSAHPASAIMDVGSTHVCAVIGGASKCWGANKEGQLGRGDTNTTGDEPGEMGDDLITVDLGSEEEASDLSLGKEFSCALLESGGLKCFGQNSEGQLGQGDNTDRGKLAGELGDALDPIDFGTGLSPTFITTGCEHACALLSNGAVKCFGYNNYGQLGQGSSSNAGDSSGEMGDNLKAVPLGDDTVKSITAGCDFTCALMETTEIFCWGRNTWGQLGTGDGDDRLDGSAKDLVAVDLDGSVVTEIVAGDDHVCALLDDSSVKCWGHNNVGQLGLGDKTDRGDTANTIGANLPAVELDTGDVVVGMGLGESHTCVLLDDGSVKCFGANGNGQLGIGSDVKEVGSAEFDMGRNLTAADLGFEASDLYAGGLSNCAVKADDSFTCWGRGNDGQLGQGDDEDIGDVKGDLPQTEAVDIGTDPLATGTLSPTDSTFSPTLTPGTTASPSSANAPSSSDSTSGPVASTSSASAHFAGGLLVSVILGSVGCVAVLFP